jgi:hypothetical protein
MDGPEANEGLAVLQSRNANENGLTRIANGSNDQVRRVRGPPIQA